MVNAKNFIKLNSSDYNAVINLLNDYGQRIDYIAGPILDEWNVPADQLAMKQETYDNFFGQIQSTCFPSGYSGMKYLREAKRHVDHLHLEVYDEGKPSLNQELQGELKIILTSESVQYFPGELERTVSFGFDFSTPKHIKNGEKVDLYKSILKNGVPVIKRLENLKDLKNSGEKFVLNDVSSLIVVFNGNSEGNLRLKCKRYEFYPQQVSPHFNHISLPNGQLENKFFVPHETIQDGERTLEIDGEFKSQPSSGCVPLSFPSYCPMYEKVHPLAANYNFSYEVKHTFGQGSQYEGLAITELGKISFQPNTSLALLESIVDSDRAIYKIRSRSKDSSNGSGYTMTMTTPVGGERETSIETHYNESCLLPECVDAAGNVDKVHTLDLASVCDPNSSFRFRLGLFSNQTLGYDGLIFSNDTILLDDICNQDGKLST